MRRCTVLISIYCLPYWQQLSPLSPSQSPSWELPPSSDRATLTARAGCRCLSSKGGVFVESMLTRWREDTPGCANCVHFNNAGAGLMPRSVFETITAHLNCESWIGSYKSSDEAEGAVRAAYSNIAELLGAQPHNIAVVENATVAFFQALSAFDFRPGDVIVTTRNDYISNQLAYLSLAKRQGIEVRRAENLPSGEVDPQSVRELLRDPRVKLLAVTWVPTNSGLMQPVEALGEVAEAAAVPYLVDACQAVGQIPINLSRLRCDFLSATARKFLRGPRGIGFLYVSDRALQRGDYPLYIDMRGANWVTTDGFELAPDARRFENWEFAYALLLGLGEASRYALSVGIHRGGGRARTCRHSAHQTFSPSRLSSARSGQRPCRYCHRGGPGLGRDCPRRRSAWARHQHFSLSWRLRDHRHGGEERYLCFPNFAALLQHRVGVGHPDRGPEVLSCQSGLFLRWLWASPNRWTFSLGTEKSGSRRSGRGRLRPSPVRGGL